MKVEERKLLQASSVLFILNIAASAFNYLCQLLLARVLSVEAFGTMNTIFSFMLIVGVPGTTLTMIVAKYYAETNRYTNLSEKRTYLSIHLKGVFVLTICSFFIFILLRAPLGRLLAIDDPIILLLTFGLAALGFYHPLYSGVFSGNRCFIWVGWYSLLIPFYKIISIIMAALLTMKGCVREYTILIVMIVGTLFTAIIGHKKSTLILGKLEKSSLFRKEKIEKYLKIEDFHILLLNICLMLYMNIDLLSVRYHEINSESGLYSSVLLFGRIIYYFSTTLGTILLPVVAAREMKKKEKIKMLNKTLLAMISFSIVCIIPINLFKEFFIQLLYGIEYLKAERFVKYISLISLNLSICTILVNYFVAIGKTKFVTIVMLIMNILLVFIAMIIKDINQILFGIALVGVIGVIVIYLFILYQREKEIKLEKNK